LVFNDLRLTNIDLRFEVCKRSPPSHLKVEAAYWFLVSYFFRHGGQGAGAEGTVCKTAPAAV
jgi:hypothetical protein